MSDLTARILEVVAKLKGEGPSLAAPPTFPAVSPPLGVLPSTAGVPPNAEAPGLASRAPTTSTDSPRAPSGYAFPWPDLLVGLGVRRVQPFDLCADCRSGTWVAYGTRPLCLACARQRGAATGTD